MTVSLSGMNKKAAASDLPMWAQPLFASTIIPQILDGNDTLVWAVEGDCSTASISEQFKANAGDYHKRYAASDHFEELFRRALSETQIEVKSRPLILDLGSGSGVNSIVPCMRLFPEAHSVATDLSAELLTLLAAYARNCGEASYSVCVQMDAMTDHVQPGVFDLVTGAAILHHLERPSAGLAAAARALRAGGHAIFMEPFDGHCLLRLAYERILAEAVLRGEKLHPQIERALCSIILDTQVRTNRDPWSDTYKTLDDKWLFSRESIVQMAHQAGFSRTHIVPHASEQELYQRMAHIQIRLFTGQSDLQLPGWADSILQSFDSAIPEAFKRNALLEGTIVLTK